MGGIVRDAGLTIDKFRDLLKLLANARLEPRGHLVKGRAAVGSKPGVRPIMA